MATPTGPNGMVRAGRLRQRIEIQAPNEIQNELGELAPDPADPWRTIARRWGRFEPGGGGETLYADQVSASVSGTVTMRYYSGLTAKHRLRLNGRVLNVDSVINPSELKAQTEMMVAVTEPK